MENNSTQQPSHLKPLNTNTTTKYGVGNPGPVIEQTQTCVCTKPGNGTFQLKMYITNYFRYNTVTSETLNISRFSS